MFSLRHNQNDLQAGFGLALVILPLALAIGVASGAPMLSGVLTAIVGGLLTSILRSSSITINGPSAGMAAVVVSGVLLLGEGDPIIGFRYFLGATVLAGILQLIGSFLRLGESADIIPSAAIHGMLAGVGVLLFTSQLPIALGLISVQFTSPIDTLSNIPSYILDANPLIVLISILSVFIIYNYKKISTYIKVPLPILIVLATTPIILFFDFNNSQDLSVAGYEISIGPQYLLRFPEHLTGLFTFPLFDKINTVSFWSIAFNIAILSSIETIISSKAVDKLDTARRKTNLNKELFAVGLSNCTLGIIGGLPLITAIPVYNGGRTKLSNIYYGIFLIIFIIFLAPFIQYISQACLAILLIFTGYKLASPKMILDTYKRGDDQFLIFISTLTASISIGLIEGIVVGILTTLFIHFAKSNMGYKQFWGFLIKPAIRNNSTENNYEYYLYLEGIINFVNIPKLKRTLRSLSEEKHIVLDMSNARLIDYTALEYLHEEARLYDIPYSQFELIGLEAHDASSRHPNATRVLPDNKKPQLTQRQESLAKISKQFNGTFWPEINWDNQRFKGYYLFQNRTIEYRSNTAKGNYKMFFEWESCDITFKDTILFSNQERHTTVMLLHLPFNAPKFILHNKSSLTTTIKKGVEYYPVSFMHNRDFDHQFYVTGESPEHLLDFLDESILNFLLENPDYKIESNGSTILMCKDMRFATPSSVSKRHEFSQEFISYLMAAWKKQPLDLKTLL